VITVLAGITRLFSLLLAPFARMSPWVGLIVASALSGAVLLLVFRYASHQRRLRAAKDRVMAHLLEVVLYRDDPRVVLRAQARLLRDNLRYLGHTLLPLAVMVLPAVLLIIQLDLHYGRRPLRVGEHTILAVKVLPRAASLDGVSISVPPGVEVDTPALRVPSEHEVDWRLVARKSGVHQVRIRAGGREFVKEVVVAERGGPLAQERGSRDLRTQFLHPGEPPLPRGAAVASVRVTYPRATLPLGRWRLYWLWPWLVISMAVGYALRGPLRVQL
jgi:hypothetical protein